MNSFSNLGYTLGCNVSPGSGLGPYGYTPPTSQAYASNISPGLGQQQHPTWQQQLQQQQANNSAGQMPPGPHNNQQAYPNNASSSNYWNGWQYNPQGTTAPQQQSFGNNQGPQEAGSSMNQSQYMNWRNVSGQSPSFPHQTRSTAAAAAAESPFAVRSYQTPQHQQQQNPGNVPYWTPNTQQQYGGGGAASTTSMIQPLDPQTFQNFGGAPQEKAIGCHVRIGAQGDQPEVFYPGDNNKQDQGRVRVGSTNNPSAAQQRGGPSNVFQEPRPGSLNMSPLASSTFQQQNAYHARQQQSPAAFQQQQYSIGQNLQTFQQPPQQHFQQTPAAGAPPPAGNNRMQLYNPCGNCPACQAQTKFYPRQSQQYLVRGGRGPQPATNNNNNKQSQQQQGILQTRGFPTVAQSMAQLQQQQPAAGHVRPSTSINH